MVLVVWDGPVATEAWKDVNMSRERVDEDLQSDRPHQP